MTPTTTTDAASTSISIRLRAGSAAARGRRRCDLVPAQRRRRLTALAMKRFLGWPNRLIERHFDVSRRGLQKWYESASRYPESEGDARLKAAVDWDAVLAALNIRAIAN